MRYSDRQRGQKIYDFVEICYNSSKEGEATRI